MLFVTHRTSLLELKRRARYWWKMLVVGVRACTRRRVATRLRAPSSLISSSSVLRFLLVNCLTRLVRLAARRLEPFEGSSTLFSGYYVAPRSEVSPIIDEYDFQQGLTCSPDPSDTPPPHTTSTFFVLPIASIMFVKRNESFEKLYVEILTSFATVSKDISRKYQGWGV